MSQTHRKRSPADLIARRQTKLEQHSLESAARDGHRGRVDELQLQGWAVLEHVLQVVGQLGQRLGGRSLANGIGALVRKGEQLLARLFGAPHGLLDLAQ